jgi:hypothetical protein
MEPLCGSGSKGSAPFGRERFLRLTGPAGRRVLRFDSSLWPLRVVVAASPMEPLRGSGSKGSEGNVSPDGDEYEVSVTGFTFVSLLLHDIVL